MFTLLSATTTYNKSSIASLFANQTIAPASWFTVLFSLIAAFAVGVFIYWTYRTNYRGVMYNNNYGLTLILMTLITTPVVMCIRDSIQLSMGMVGALSIVRFRTAVKDPLDTAYMFWALTMGILLGAGLYVIALVVVLGISVFVLLMTFVKVPSATSYLLVLHCDDSAMQAVQGVLARIKYRRMRSKTVTQNGTEMTVEVRISERQDLVGQLLDIPGVYDATLVSCQSEAGA